MVLVLAWVSAFGGELLPPLKTRSHKNFAMRAQIA